MLLLALSVGFVHAQPDSDSIIGKFKGEFSTNQRTLRIAIECSSTTECLFDWGNSKGNKFNSVLRFEDFDIASNAIECIRRRDLSRIKNPEILAEHRSLVPMLTSGAKLEKCWDMNNPTPGYTLACTVNQTKFADDNIYLFVAAPSRRGEGECGYMIFPLSR